MPTYVYRRSDGTTFDVFQKISDAPLTADPVTGEPITRVISGGAGLQFKGDGFYLTDYVRKKDNGSSESSAKESASSDAKPAKPSSAKESTATASPAKSDG